MQCDLHTQVTIGRATLGLGNLFLNRDTGWSFDRNGIEFGENSLRRTTVETPYVNGRTLVNAVPDQQVSVLKLYCHGANDEEIFSKIDGLRTALFQFQYLIAVEVGGSTWIWNCEPADFTIGNGGAIEDLLLRQGLQRVTATIPRKPDGSVVG
jgi:hypothetical protein